MKRIIIIGAGVIGCSIARELSRYDASVLVLESNNDVACGTSKANSGIVHAGFDAKPGTLKAKFNILGNPMFDRLSKELDFPFKRIGAMVLCFDEQDFPALTALYQKGVKNGVEGLEVLMGDKVREIEPYVSDKVVAALVAPTSGIVGPYEMTIAYAENAYTNGVSFEFNKKVTSIKQSGEWIVECEDGSSYSADLVINCAGVFADEINNMVCDDKIKIVARKGEYMLLDKTTGYIAGKTLFQLPTAMGKGILVSPTTHGNILLGPTALDVEDKLSTSTTVDGLNDAFSKACQSVPSLNKRMVITQFSGLRAHNVEGDFVIGMSAKQGFYNVAGIESPGLTSAPAIAVHVAKEAAEYLELGVNADFNPIRKGIKQFATMSDDEREKAIAENPLYGKVVCRCEVVTEGEIVDSINRPLGAKDLDGVKRRTRAGMGRCQSGFCTSRIMEILARETGVDMQDVTKFGKGSNLLIGRVK